MAERVTEETLAKLPMGLKPPFTVVQAKNKFVREPQDEHSDELELDLTDAHGKLLGALRSFIFTGRKEAEWICATLNAAPTIARLQSEIAALVGALEERRPPMVSAASTTADLDRIDGIRERRKALLANLSSAAEARDVKLRAEGAAAAYRKGAKALRNFGNNDNQADFLEMCADEVDELGFEAEARRGEVGNG